MHDAVEFANLAKGGVMKAGVIGMGKFGKIHARVYAELDQFKLVGVSDPIMPNNASMHGATWCPDYRDLLKLGVEAVSIATPTSTHHEVATFFMRHDVHCLIEKPIALTMAEANDLIEKAALKNIFLLVGMSERFNSAYEEARRIITAPLFIEAHRLCPFPNRSTDTSVVLDLMIHDLDIILDLVGKKVTALEGVGIPVLTKKADIANARIHFEGGCIANITASRISDQTMRRTRVFFNRNYLSLDFLNHTVKAFKAVGTTVEEKTIPIEIKEPLKQEILYFHTGITSKSQDLTMAKNAALALDLALKIDEDLTK